MAAEDPTLAESQDVSTWTSADLGQVTDMLSGLTDGDTGTSIEKIGKSPEDCLRLEYANLKGKSVGDTITVHWPGNHNVGTMACLVYDGATTVTETDKLTYVMSGGTPAVFTLTQAFMDALHDLGSGKGAVRITEDGGISGDFQCAEVDADLVDAAGGDVDVAVANATITITGQAPSAEIDVVAAVANATITTTGQAVTLDDLTPVVNATVTITGQVPVVALGPLAVPVGKADLVVTGQVPTVALGPLSVPVGKADLVATGQAPSVEIDVVAAVANATLTSAGQGVTLDELVPVANAALAIAGQVPIVDDGAGAGEEIAVANATLTTTGQAPSVEIDVVAAPANATITIAGQVPSVPFDVEVAVANATLTTAGQAVTLDQPVAVANASITVTGQGVVAAVDTPVAVANATITTTGQAPSAEIDVVVVPANAALTLPVFAPQAQSGYPVANATITASGQAIVLDLALSPVPNATVTVTGQVPTVDVSADVFLVPAGAITIIGQPVEALAQLAVEVSVGNASLTLVSQTVAAIDFAIDIPVVVGPVSEAAAGNVNINIAFADLTLASDPPDTLPGAPYFEVKTGGSRHESRVFGNR